MANQHTPCKLDSLEPQLLAWVEAEVNVRRHSYARVSTALGWHVSSFKRHWRKHATYCVPKRLAEARRAHMAPEFCHVLVTLPDGQQVFHRGHDPRLGHERDILPTVELLCEFENMPVQNPVQPPAETAKASDVSVE